MEELESKLVTVLIGLYDTLSYLETGDKTPKEFFIIQEKKWKEACRKSNKEYLEPVFWNVMRKERPELYETAVEVGSVISGA